MKNKTETSNFSTNEIIKGPVLCTGSFFDLRLNSANQQISEKNGQRPPFSVLPGTNRLHGNCI